LSNDWIAPIHLAMTDFEQIDEWMPVFRTGIALLID
jgi:hypothetical protein